jgi:hypothetical protein
MHSERLLMLLGALSMVIGLASMLYLHAFVARDLQRTVDVSRRLIDDAIVGVAALSQTAAATDAVRGPSNEAVARSVAMLDPAIALLGAMDRSLGALPGGPSETKGIVGRLSEALRPEDGTADDGVLAGVADLRRAIRDAAADARRLRHPSRAMSAAMQRHDIPSFQPVLAALRDRLHETRSILTDTNPARGVTVLADLVAGVYVVLGGALVLAARMLERARPRLGS